MSGRVNAKLLLLGCLLLGGMTTLASGQTLAGGDVDPTLIPKYVIPLVIPPVMNDRGTSEGGMATPNDYYIAVREFKQQILPGGIWNTINGREDNYAPTTVWSYGPAADTTPKVAPDPGSQFNYPACTIETRANTEVKVRWINDLVDMDGDFLPHLLPVDQTVHWANPPAGPGNTDSVGDTDEVYEGPVPIVTHVHGAHVGPESDGYPEAWWLPAANNIPAGYATSGSLFDDSSGANPGNLGFADFRYPNDQPATTLWYHDHSLGMTRLNVYAGPAGFWLVRGDFTGPGGVIPDVQGLPGPAPVAGQGVLELNVPGHPVRSSIREIPIVVQDRSFQKNGKSLFYPGNRAFFEGVEKRDLRIDLAPEGGSDVLPVWQPEAFFNVMVVNGVSWPELKVAQGPYRLRLLNGCNSRFLNLALRVVNSDGSLGAEIPFYQIGAEQGFLPRVVRIQTGESTPLPGEFQDAAHPDQALLMGLAERADVIVDFRGLANGTTVRMTNTAPDAPFSGFGDEPADPDTTGQVMQFVVDATLTKESDTNAPLPQELVLSSEPGLTPSGNTPRKVSLNEEVSKVVCVLFDPVADALVEPIKQVDCLSTPPAGLEVVPFGPTAALLGTVDLTSTGPVGVPLKWTAAGAGVKKTVQVPAGPVDVWVTENPDLNAVEEWDIYNFTEDAHPIHLHLVRFEVVQREIFRDGSGVRDREPWEAGFKDTVIAYPGEITRVRAHFDIAGLYVWHCHIVEHEDNEMMRPYFVGP